MKTITATVQIEIFDDPQFCHDGKHKGERCPKMSITGLCYHFSDSDGIQCLNWNPKAVKHEKCQECKDAWKLAKETGYMDELREKINGICSEQDFNKGGERKA